MTSKKPTLTQRMEHVEGCIVAYDNRFDTIDASIKELKHDLGNGLGERIGKIVAVEIAQHQKEEWEREREERRLQLEAYKVQNDIKGKDKDRINRLLIGAMPVISAIVTLILARVI